MSTLMTALRWIGRLIRQDEALEIVTHTDALLEVRHQRAISRLDTQFRSDSHDVLQRGRRMTTFTAIRGIHLSEEADSDGPPLRAVDLVLDSGKRLRIGRSLDELSASICAARISALTGKPVSADRQLRPR